MLSSKVTLMRRLGPFTGWLAVLAGLLGAAPRPLVWQTGQVRIDPAVQVEPAGDAEAQLPLPAPLQERESEPLPHWQMVFLRVHLTIDSGQGTYTVEHRVTSSVPVSLLADASTGELARAVGSPRQVLPWLAYLPAPLPFAVQGRSLYYRDAKGKSHKASIIHVVP